MWQIVKRWIPVRRSVHEDCLAGWGITTRELLDARLSIASRDRTIEHQKGLIEGLKQKNLEQDAQLTRFQSNLARRVWQIRDEHIHNTPDEEPVRFFEGGPAVAVGPVKLESDVVREQAIPLKMFAATVSVGLSEKVHPEQIAHKLGQRITEAVLRAWRSQSMLGTNT